MTLGAKYIYEIIRKSDPLGKVEEVALTTGDYAHAWLVNIEDKFGYGLVLRHYEVLDDGTRKFLREELRRP